jgi:hypothetical protein
MFRGLRKIEAVEVLELLITRKVENPTGRSWNFASINKFTDSQKSPDTIVTPRDVIDDQRSNDTAPIPELQI